MFQRMHTGCKCRRCKRGRDKYTRRTFHRKVGQTQKREIEKYGDVINLNISIGYTD